MCPVARNLQEEHQVGELSGQEPQQAWKCSSEPWLAGLSWNRPREGGPYPACTRNFASCTGLRPRAIQNTIEDSAGASKSLIHTPLLRVNGFMRNNLILMKISLARRGTTTDPPSSVQRPDGSTVLGHRGRTPGHGGHPGTYGCGEESRIPPTITTTLPPTSESTNPGSRLPRERKLPLERTSLTPSSTMMTMKTMGIYPMPGPTTRTVCTPDRVGRRHRPVTILC